MVLPYGRAVLGDRKVCRSLDPVRQPDTVPLTPFGDGMRRTKPQSRSTTMHSILQAHVAPTIARFTLYRTLRRITGPAFAYRIAFGGRA